MTRSAHVITYIAFGLMAAFVALGTLFAAGEIMSDPGGWTGAGAVALWLVPMLVLSFVAWRWPSVGAWVMGGLLVLLAGGWIWYAVDTSGWSDLFRDVPLLSLSMLAVLLPIAVLGLKRPAVAGAMLVISAVVSYGAFLSTIEGEPLRILSSLTTSRTVTVVPALVVGLLFLLGAALGHRGGEPAAVTPPPDTPSEAAPELTDTSTPKPADVAAPTR